MREKLGVKGELQTGVKILIHKQKVMDAGHRWEACGPVWPADVFPSRCFKNFQMCCLPLKIRRSSHKFWISSSLETLDLVTWC